jgi:hypothetical protein
MKRDPAEARFFVLQLVRLSGVLLALGGVVLLSGRFGDFPQIAGYAIVLAGLAEFFAVPPILARRWKSKE